MVEKIKLSEINTIINDKYDIFLCTSSFEDRCLSIAKNINISNIGYAIIIYNKEFIDYIYKNNKILTDIFINKNTLVEIMQSEPISSTDIIITALSKIIKENDKTSILLDITTFTHETLLILIKIFNQIFPNIVLTCMYSNALDYDFDNQRDKKWLSKGIKEIRSVLGYSGNILPERKTHLIILVGYEYERATKIIYRVQPSTLALGYGRSENATTDKDKDANEHYLKLVQNMAVDYLNIENFEIICNDPFKTSEKIKEIIKNENDKNIVIVPLNNKISTIGVALAALNNNEIQLCYAPALIYNYENYSKAGNDCYIFNMSIN